LEKLVQKDIEVCAWRRFKYTCTWVHMVKASFAVMQQHMIFLADEK
jgi:CCR4-NOT transcriptional regulation complex NOT5 subunit